MHRVARLRARVAPMPRAPGAQRFSFGQAVTAAKPGGQPAAHARSAPERPCPDCSSPNWPAKCRWVQLASRVATGRSRTGEDDDGSSSSGADEGRAAGRARGYRRTPVSGRRSDARARGWRGSDQGRRGRRQQHRHQQAYRLVLEEGHGCDRNRRRRPVRRGRRQRCHVVRYADGVSPHPGTAENMLHRASVGEHPAKAASHAAGSRCGECWANP